ncbi:MAG TPA: hypothetical protein VGU66_18080 [Candidatus Elarobacter sp.]|nr:hypothetical protein [Candidatus Elarobacter sp.]
MGDIPAPDNYVARLDSESFDIIAARLREVVWRDSQLPRFIREASGRIVSTTAAGVTDGEPENYAPALKATYIAAQALLFNIQNFEPPSPLSRTLDVSAGFVFAPEAGSSAFSYGPWCFGVVIHCDAAEGAITGPINFGTTAAFGSVFPVFLINAPVEQHVLPAITWPASGSCSLWVTPRGTRRWGEGLLTARHVVEKNFDAVDVTPVGGSAVTTSTVEYTACTIDAAVVDASGVGWPTGVSPVTIVGSVASPVACGATIQLEGKNTTATGSILRIHQDVLFVGTLFGQRIITDVHGVPGDSGGVIRVLPSREPCGAYLGSFFSAGEGTPKHGIAQSLYQAIEYFELNAFQ